MTTGLLGVDDRGNPDPSAAPATELSTGPGFEKTWFDVNTRTVVSA